MVKVPYPSCHYQIYNFKVFVDMFIKMVLLINMKKNTNKIENLNS